MNETTQKENPKDQDRPLTREQRRHKERVERDAQITLSRLADKFYQVFMDEEPESILIDRKRKELSAKWKMYCAKNRLITEAYGLFDNAAKAILEKYKVEVEKE